MQSAFSGLSLGLEIRDKKQRTSTNAKVMLIPQSCITVVYRRTIRLELCGSQDHAENIVLSLVACLILHYWDLSPKPYIIPI